MATEAAKFEANALALLAEARNALILEIAANLTEACPVDTGHARANFVPSINEPFTGEAVDGRPIAAGTVALLAAGIESSAYVTNNVPYIGRLIAGSSSQAPAGWDVAAVDAAAATIAGQYEDVQIGAVTGNRRASVLGDLKRAQAFDGDQLVDPSEVE